MLKGHTSEVTSVAWSQGNQLASASADQTAVVWNIASGEQVAQLTGHTGLVHRVTWGQGDQLSSVSADQTGMSLQVSRSLSSQGSLGLSTASSGARVTS